MSMMVLIVRYRSTIGSYQMWADMVDDQSYTFDKLLPYFKKSCTFTPPNYSKRAAGSNVSYDPSVFSPSGGPLHVSYANYYSPTAPHSKTAYEKLGFNMTAGPNSGKLLGFSEYTYSLDPRTSTRSSSQTSFLQKAIASTGLTIYPSTLAKRIIFNQNKKATGVIVNTLGSNYLLSASKEVIVSAGPVSW